MQMSWDGVGGRGREKVRWMLDLASFKGRAGEPWTEIGRCVSISGPAVEVGRVSSLRPRNGMWGSSRISTFRDRKFRLSDHLEGM